MAYAPRDRREEDALALYRLQADADAFLLRVAQLVGPSAKLQPALRLSVAAIREAIEDLTSDIAGELARLDPDRLLQATADRERILAMVAQARTIFPDLAELESPRRLPAAAE